LAPEILEPLIGEVGRLLFRPGGIGDRLGRALAAIDARDLWNTLTPLRTLGQAP
jgi:hypothetical protein